MSDEHLTLPKVLSCGRAPLEITHPIDKQESRKINKFQYIGFLLREADAVVAQNEYLAVSVMIQFGFDIDTLGYGTYAPMHILSAPNWKIRMYAAWCVIGSADRDAALKLNYDDTQNYWPNTDFLEPGWVDGVRHWALCHSAQERLKEHPIELEIARWVGQPPRPAIEYVQ